MANLRRRVNLYADYCYWHEPYLADPGNTDGIELQGGITVQKWQRYSNRQQRAMNIDGLVRRFTLTGKLDTWLLWLRLGQYTHLGKNTSFGLGQYRLLRLGSQDE